MFANQTIEKLEALGLHAMAAGLAEQLSAPGTYDELAFADRLGLLVDKEADARDSRRLAARLKAAKLRYPAAVEDIDFRSPQGPRPLGDIGVGPGGMGEGAPQRARHRLDRLWQELPRLCAGQRGRPPGPYCALPAHAEVVGRPGPRAGRRPLRPHPFPDGARRRPRAGRLPVQPGPGRGLPGPVGGGGGPLRAALDGRGQPAAGRQVAPLDGRPHVGRRRFGPRLPSGPPHHAEGRLDAQTPARAVEEADNA